MRGVPETIRGIVSALNGRSPGPHVVMNHRGELMAIKITPGNVDDRAPLAEMADGLEGKLLADKGYISKKLFTKLWAQGLHLITGIRRNMKNYR